MTSLRLCPSCAAAVPVGRFCAVCGGPLTDDCTPGATAPAPPVAAAPVHTWSAPQDQRGEATRAPGEAVTAGVTLVPGVRLDGDGPAVGSAAARPSHGRVDPRRAGVLALVVVAGLAAVLSLGRGGSHTITGDLSLSESGLFSLSAGDSCSGTEGYDDIHSGAEVRVRDENGTLVATGTLDAGTFDGVYCVFTFSVPDVPAAEFYEVSAGGDQRGGIHFSTRQLEAAHWTAHLSLGS